MHRQRYSIEPHDTLYPYDCLVTYHNVNVLVLVFEVLENMEKKKTKHNGKCITGFARKKNRDKKGNGKKACKVKSTSRKKPRVLYLELDLVVNLSLEHI